MNMKTMGLIIHCQVKKSINSDSPVKAICITADIVMILRATVFRFLLHSLPVISSTHTSIEQKLDFPTSHVLKHESAAALCVYMKTRRQPVASRMNGRESLLPPNETAHTLSSSVFA